MIDKDYENGENIDLQNVQSGFITEDLLTFIGVIVGALSCVFLAIYWKCKNDVHVGYHPPYLTRRFREPFPGSLMIQCDQLPNKHHLTSQSTLTEITDDVQINNGLAASSKRHCFLCRDQRVWSYSPT